MGVTGVLWGMSLGCECGVAGTGGRLKGPTFVLIGDRLLRFLVCTGRLCWVCTRSGSVTGEIGETLCVLARACGDSGDSGGFSWYAGAGDVDVA
jgi:hypothetical protein